MQSTDSDDSAPPPTRAGLKAWWKQFTLLQRVKREAQAAKQGVFSCLPMHCVILSTSAAGTDPNAPPTQATAGKVFGVPLRESLKYASVQISTADQNGELYVWGYVPVVVAKCGLYLKENATEVPGTFRVSGSAKRMRDLQATFEKPPRYGKSLDWKKEHYTTHDVASVFRRYLTQMPEPVIPHQLYHQFRDTMAKKPFDRDQAIKTYQRLIRSMPRANQYLLLYVLDLLSVFARKSDINLMPASNLALIFRPGLISHPSHELSPEEHQLSLQVLEFLIAQQDYFMMDLSPPPIPPTPSVDSPQPQFPVPPQPVLPPPVNTSAAAAAPSAQTGAAPSPGEESSDVYMVPSSSDSDPPSGGWKLISKGKKEKLVQRRQTTDSRRSKRAATQSDAPRRGGALSTVYSEEGEDRPSPVDSVASSTGVKRSRTLPSRKGDSPATTPAEPQSQPQPRPRERREREREHKANVLSKRQKRLSQQPVGGSRVDVGPRAVEAPT
ncbi:Rho GTPase activation protein [Calocera viscosa TUFC12733]|uniref:Rho GTPase activation protein n=1 Tax=Calocera viscosa (strain TUFC12733) TaxID=1330018 RepID=A0A167QYN6_CALVF|nr:Rho GTPase activation protein [Calocera viscosa TUFC12733]